MLLVYQNHIVDLFEINTNRIGKENTKDEIRKIDNNRKGNNNKGNNGKGFVPIETIKAQNNDIYIRGYAN